MEPENREEYTIADSYDLSEEASPAAEEKADTRHAWQRTKEGWYDHVPLTVRQLDIIIACGIVGLVIVAVLIGLDAAGVF